MERVLGPLIDVLAVALNWLHSVVGDYGIAIILLTVALRVLMIPLTWKQTKSMYEMQRIQPKIKELQKKYKNDKEKLQEETLRFYQENKVNPFGGCLPLLLQMPIFIALFYLLGSTGLDLGSFWVLIPDLTATPSGVFSGQGLLSALPYLTLVALFGLSAWLPQKLMPGEKQQQMIGLYMAIFMLWIGWISPAGVLLYWVTSSIWQIGQQQITLKVISAGEGAK